MPKISGYANGGPIQAADQFVIARAGVNKSILGSEVDKAFIGARIYKTGNQTITDSVGDPIMWDAEDYDTDGFWPGGDNSEIVLPFDGVYIVTASIVWADTMGSPNVFDLGVTLNVDSGIGAVASSFAKASYNYATVSSPVGTFFGTAGAVLVANAWQDKAAGWDVMDSHAWWGVTQLAISLLKKA